MGQYEQFKGRHLLTITDYSPEEMVAILDLADELKARRKAGRQGTSLQGQHVALVFEKSSTRTRAATSVAAAAEGATAEYLSSNDIHLGKKESIADTARVLGRLFDGIMFRGFQHETVEILAQRSGVPVWNGLTDSFHPTQALADLMTIREHFGRLQGLKVVYMGDGRNNVANSLMLACVRAGIEFVNCAPEALRPDPALMQIAQGEAEVCGGSATYHSDPIEAVQGAHVVYTDVWVSMGEEDLFEERVQLLKPYQVNRALMDATGRVGTGEVMFLHCLPAYHDHNTRVSAECGALEVTDEVFEADYSRVFDQAENRMHTIRAVMVASLAGDPDE